MLDLAGNPEGARQITFIELDDRTVFPVRRVYWLHSLADGEVRGYHAHRDMQQLVIAVSGKFRFELDDGDRKREFILDDPARALWVPAGLWRMIYTLAPSSALLVLASSHFDEADYIRDYAEYLDYVRALPGA